MNREIQITTIKDDKVIEARLLQTSKGRLSENKILLEGQEQIVWAIQSTWQIAYVFVHDKEKNTGFTNELRVKGFFLCYCSEGILKKITDTSYLVPYVAVAKRSDTREKNHPDFVIVLDGVQDFGNIGTIIRTAAAFGMHDFVTTEENVDFYYKKTIDASRGAVFGSSLRRFKSGTEAIQRLKREGYQIAVTTPHASTMQSFAKVEEKPIALVFGNETHGASQEVMDQADLKIQIPMSGPMESLNVGVAAGISLYEMKIKWILTMLTKKIQESLGRDLYSASRWIRLVFDAKLKEVCPFNADQAIMMMILKCEGTLDAAKLAHDAGLLRQEEGQALIHALVKKDFISNQEGGLSLLEKGEEAIAKIWNVHELTENIAFDGVSHPEKENFLKVLKKILSNCEKTLPFS